MIKPSKNIYIQVALLFFFVLTCRLFADNNTSKLSTDNHPKSKGVNLSFEYPANWIVNEGKHPNTLYTVGNPDGSEYCSILIKEIPEALTIFSDEDLAEILFENISTEVPLSGLIFQKGELTKFDGQPGFWVEYNGIVQRAGLKMPMYMMLQQFVYDKRMIQLTYSVTAINLRDLNHKYTQIKPLFFKIGNSIVIHDKWENAPSGSYDQLKLNIAKYFAVYAIVFLAIISACALGIWWIIRRLIKRRNLQKDQYPVYQSCDLDDKHLVNDPTEYEDIIKDEEEKANDENNLIEGNHCSNQDVPPRLDNKPEELDYIIASFDESNLRRFNFGAFLVAPLWNLVYKRWGWVFVLIVYNAIVSNMRYMPLSQVWPFALFGYLLNFLSAINANKAGWRNKKQSFKSVHHYLDAQKKWVVWGIILNVGVFILQNLLYSMDSALH